MATRRPRLKIPANLSIKRPSKSSTDTKSAEDHEKPPIKKEPQLTLKVEKPEPSAEDPPKQKAEDVKVSKTNTPTPTSASKDLEFKFPNPVESVNKIDLNGESNSPKKADVKASNFNGINIPRKRIRTESLTSNKSFTNLSESGSKSSRKASRSEESQRMVEAKKDFRKRLNNIQNLDKQSLTMYDMIYYNPAKNPMKASTATPNTINTNINALSKKMSVENIPLKIEKEVERPPTPPPPKPTVQLTPQLKLGPNGEMILDEKSLIIENEKEKELRDSLAKAEIVYDDEFSGNSGYYSRYKRTRDWPPEETIRFYRCLHTIGTDFSMMEQLFPNRSRRDLKLKFKKEEKLNLGLINKALLFPKQFNIEDLQKQFQDEDEELVQRKEAQKQIKLEIEEKMRNEKKRKEKELQKIRNKTPKKKISKSSYAMTNGDFVLENEHLYDQKNEAKKKRKIKTRRKMSVVEDDDLDDDDMSTLDINAMEIDIIDYEPDILNAASKSRIELTESTNKSVEKPVDTTKTKTGEGEEEGGEKVANATNEKVVKNISKTKSDESAPSTSAEKPAFPLDIDVNSLVLVESQDTMNPEKTIYEIYVISPETGVLSEKPLDIPEDVIETIRSIIEVSED